MNSYTAGLFKSVGAELTGRWTRISHNFSPDCHAYVNVTKSNPFPPHETLTHTILHSQLQVPCKHTALLPSSHTEGFSSKPFNFPSKILILGLLLPPLKMGFSPCTCLWYWQIAMQSLPVFCLLD